MGKIHRGEKKLGYSTAQERKVHDRGNRFRGNTNSKSRGCAFGMTAYGKLARFQISEVFVITAVHAKPAVLIAIATHRPFAIDAVLHQHLLGLRLRDVG